MGIVECKLREYLNKHRGTVAWRVSKHCEVLEKHLNPDEEVLFVFVGQKNPEFYSLFTTCAIAITNKRMMIAQKRVVWGYFFKSITADLFNDLSVYQGLIWGSVEIDTVKEKVILTNLSKSGLADIETNITENMMKNKKAMQENNL